MKINNLIKSIFIIFVVTISCKEENVNKTIRVDKPQKNEYVLLNYRINGIDTVLHGKYQLFKNNKLKEDRNYVLGKPYGTFKQYFENGKIEVEGFALNNNVIAEEIWNYPSGEKERYILYDDLGKSIFIVKFDKKGNLISHNGYPLIETLQYKYANKTKFNIKEEQYLKIGDTLKYSYLVANIPNAKRSFTIENLSIDNAKVKRITKKIEPCQLDVKEVLTKKGKNTIRSIVRYEFNDNVTPVFTDTLSFDVEVH
jgi:hypothetical protein